MSVATLQLRIKSSLRKVYIHKNWRFKAGICLHKIKLIKHIYLVGYLFRISTKQNSRKIGLPAYSHYSDAQIPTPPEGGGGGGERAEGGQGEWPVVRELWFIVVMTAIALLLLAVVLGVVLHKVRPSDNNVLLHKLMF